MATALKKPTPSKTGRARFARHIGRGKTQDTAKLPRLISQVQEGFDVRQDSLVRLTGFSRRSITGWKAGQPSSEPAIRRFEELHRLQESLARVMKPAFIPQWLHAPNEAFDGLKPLEVIERGQLDRIWRMIFYLESGMPT